jgi:hypothetical protein
VSNDNFQWSPRPWALRDFPPHLQPRVRRLERDQFLLTDEINGNKVYIRRVGYNRFQWGILTPPATRS